jgi:hypothetical protein
MVLTKVPMPVKPTLPSFAAVSGVVRELYGEAAKLVDSPNAGVVGKLDEFDRLVRAEGGQLKSVKLGVTKKEDIVFRQRVVKAAHALAAGGAQFSASHKADKVNKKLWTMGYGGKIQVRKFLPNDQIGKPSIALRDMFENGKDYGFECATAMMVIYHKAILDHLGDEKFDELFSEPRMLSFFRWSVEDDDYTSVKKLVEDDKIIKQPPKPGAHYYFSNPGASEENSAFGGENVLYLGDGLYYAHGIVGDSGSYIVTEDEIMATLSALRKPGSTIKPHRIGLELEMDALKVANLGDTSSNV